MVGAGRSWWSTVVGTVERRPAYLEPVAAQAEIGRELVPGQGDRARVADHFHLLDAPADLAEPVALRHVDLLEGADRAEGRLDLADRHRRRSRNAPGWQATESPRSGTAGNAPPAV